MIRRVLLTGSTGLLGAEVLPALAAAGFEAWPVSRTPSGLPGHLACDLSDPQAAGRLLSRVEPHAVVHLAGGAEGGRHELYRANVLTTVHLLEAAARLTPPPYCVVFGSAAEYGAASRPLAETAPLQPVTEYGRAKLAQTTLAEAIARERGMALTILRPFNVVSSRLAERSPLGNLRRQLLASGDVRREVRCGRLDVLRDFIPVSAVVDAVLALVGAPQPGRVINVCSGVAIELGSILEAMARRLAVELTTVVDPALAALPAAPVVVGDPALLRELLGVSVRPSPDSLAEALLGAACP